MINNKIINLLLLGFIGALLAEFLFIPTHPFSGSLLGHAVGVLGSLLMALTLVYPFRKRILKKRGKKNPLSSHIFFGLAGPTLVLLHAGNELNSVIGMLAYFSMLLVVFSGIVGRFLFKIVNRSLKDQKKDLAQLKKLLQQLRTEVTPDDLEKYLGSGGSLPAKNEKYRTCEELKDVALSIAETEHALAVFDRTKRLFGRWTVVHLYLTAFLFAMMATHVLTTIYYGLRWLP